MRGDATQPPASEAWHPLSFDHDDHDYSSYLTNAGTESTLRCQRSDQSWPRMLLPTTNQVQAARMTSAYGGLKGDLAIFLGLIALSVGQQFVTQLIPHVFRGGAWAVHQYPHGRK